MRRSEPLIIATETAVYLLEDNGSPPALLLSGEAVRRVVEGDTVTVIALATGRVILLEGEERRELTTGIPDRIDSLCILDEQPLTLLVGTTPPHLYRVVDESRSQRVQAFEDLDVRNQWYTPWGGPAAVRSIAKSAEGWVYADIHVGSIMRSDDSGSRWEPVTPTLHEDVHEVTTTPASNRYVYANTYLSVYISEDRGKTWTHRSDGLNSRYGRGIAVHPDDPDTILCGVSDGPTGANVNGQLYYTADAGVTWTHVTAGFPASTRKNIDTFHIAYMDSDLAWVTDEAKLFRSSDRGETWKVYWEAPEEILMISCRR